MASTANTLATRSKLPAWRKATESAVVHNSPDHGVPRSSDAASHEGSTASEPIAYRMRGAQSSVTLMVDSGENTASAVTVVRPALPKAIAAASATGSDELAIAPGGSTYRSERFTSR